MVISNVQELRETALYHLRTGRRQMKTEEGGGVTPLLWAEEQLTAALRAMANHGLTETLEKIPDPRLGRNTTPIVADLVLTNIICVIE